MRRQVGGFTLLETALAGVILTMGMIFAAQLTRSNLDLVRPGQGQTLQNSAVAEQLMRAEVARLKSFRGVAGGASVASVPVGYAKLYVTTSAGAAVQSNALYALTPFDVKVQLSQPGLAPNPATDAVLAHTVCWQLGYAGGTGVRPGL